MGYAPLDDPATENETPIVIQKYRPDQARAPAGTSDGGEWVDEGGGSGGSIASSVRAPAREDGPRDENVRVAQAGSSRGTPRSPILARFPESTGAQEVRWAISNVHAQEVIARAQAAIPGYRPRDSLTSTIEGEIARNEANARDAQRALAEAAARRPARRRPSSTGSNPRSLEEVCTPGGVLVGRRTKGSGRDTTTVNRREFEDILKELTRGAEEVKPRSNYDGLWYRRTDGTMIGVRRSEGSGLTIDIVDSLNNPNLPNGWRIHVND